MNDEQRLERYFIRNSYGENRVLKSIPDDAPILACKNGIFAGSMEDGIHIFKGVPFACPPVGKFRWKAPVPARRSGQIFEAVFNGKSPIQTECESERASYYPQGEDCLYLNIWMGDPFLYGRKRPVMVFFHGGAYGWGGTADPLYDGLNFAKAHPEIVLITAGYRTGLMGFVDFSSVDGGEEFKDAPNLGLLDQIESLRWVQKNCDAFGGDPDNVTIIGESAGAGSVSLLPLIPEARGLFKKVIAESGSIALTFSKEQCQGFTKKLLKLSGAHNMDELMALSEEQLMELNTKLNDNNNFPQRDGNLIPEDLYAAYHSGVTKNIDMLIGTNAHESRYWIGEVGGLIPFRFSIPVKFENDVRKFSIKDQHRVRLFMKRKQTHSVWRMSDFYTEMMFRLPAIFQAGEHSDKGGRAFVYYWVVPSVKPYYKACHAVELAYVFGNLDETVFTGAPADARISKFVQQMWVNFVKYGNPGIEGLEWPLYNKTDRKTMIISDHPHVERDPKGTARRLLYPLLKYNVDPSYENLDIDTPFVRKTVAVGSLIGVGVLAAAVLLAVSLLKRDK